MQLLLAIVQDEDADNLSKRLNAQGLRATRIKTVGGFLARGNDTILVGVEDEQVEDVLEAIRATCHTRRSYINPTPPGIEPVHLSMAAPVMPLEVHVGGATVFSFPVRRFERIQGSDTPVPLSKPTPATQTAKGAKDMDLMLAFVQNEDADPVTEGLLEAGYRVTRINTAGAFLRRGNVTLLIGVEDDKVDDVIARIKAHCRPRDAASPLSSGMPTYSATVFVLEASRVIRV